MKAVINDILDFTTNYFDVRVYNEFKTSEKRIKETNSVIQIFDVLY